MNEAERNRRLIERLNDLEAKNQALQNEIKQIKAQFLQDIQESEEIKASETVRKPDPVVEPTFQKTPITPPPVKDFKTPRDRSAVEKFLGENLINKIGIVIIIIGVALGANYVIENNLVSPLMRIIGGYVISVALAIVALRLKGKYVNLSAVVLSGSIATAYFITFAGYSYYDLIPQMPAFLFMVALTAAGVYAALRYDKQVIAHLGLVGAYSIPFLVSSEQGNFIILFSYILLINLGILAISLKKYWKPIYPVAFVISWLIFYLWFIFEYDVSDQSLALLFASLFFLVFYVAFLGYKLLRKEEYGANDVLLVVANSIIFFLIGYALATDSTFQYATALFALVNAGVHFGLTLLFKRRKDSDIRLRNLTLALSIAALVTAVPILLDGGWVTLLWISMAAGIFYIGRSQMTWFYEVISYPLIALSFLSLLHDWMDSGDYQVVFNIQFLGSVLYMVVIFLIFRWNQIEVKDDYRLSSWVQPVLVVTSSILILTALSAGNIEIMRAWDQISRSEYVGQTQHWREISGLLYALALAGVILFLNHFKWRSEGLRKVSYVVFPVLILVFLKSGLMAISDVRELYTDNEFLLISPFWYVSVRYFAFLIVIPSLWVFYRSIADDQAVTIRALPVIGVHVVAVWLLSSELLHWMDILDIAGGYKAGLSILWGAYALFMIVIGIRKEKAYLRIAGIALFGVTLLKMFLYDISNLPTLTKTVIFLVLGALLLTVSFLYIRFREKLWGEEENK